MLHHHPCSPFRPSTRHPYFRHIAPPHPCPHAVSVSGIPFPLSMPDLASPASRLQRAHSVPARTKEAHPYRTPSLRSDGPLSVTLDRPASTGAVTATNLRFLSPSHQRAQPPSLLPPDIPRTCHYLDCQCSLSFVPRGAVSLRQPTVIGGLPHRFVKCSQCRRDNWIQLRWPASASQLPPIATCSWYRYASIAIDAERCDVLCLRFGDVVAATFPRTLGVAMRTAFAAQLRHTFPCWTPSHAPSGLAWHINESDVVVAIAATLAVLGLIPAAVAASGIHQGPLPLINIDDIQLDPTGAVIHPTEDKHHDTWACGLYLPEPPRFRPFHIAAVPMTYPRTVLFPYHSSFTPVACTLDAAAIRALPHLGVRYPDMAVAVGTSLYGSPIFSTTPYTSLHSNSYDSAATRIPWSDHRLRAWLSREQDSGCLVDISAAIAALEAYGVAPVYRVHPTSAVLKPTYGPDGQLVSDHVSKLRVVDDYSFSASPDVDVSVNGTVDTRHLPRIRLCSVGDVIANLQHQRSRLQLPATETASCGQPPSAFVEAPFALFKVDLERAYRQHPTLRAHLWMTCTRIEVGYGTTRLFCDTATPFGRSDSTGAFSPPVMATNASIQRCGINSMEYSDDFNIVGPAASASAAVALVLAIITSVGMTAQPDKLEEEGVPGPSKTVLGIHLDVCEYTASMTSSRRSKLLVALREMMKPADPRHHGRLHVGDVRSLAHRLDFICTALPQARAQLTPLFQFVHANYGRMTRKIHAPQSVFRAMEFWQHTVSGFHSASFHPEHQPMFPNAICIGDAAEGGYGCVEARTLNYFQGQWTTTELDSLPITQREAAVVVWAMYRFAAVAARPHVAMDTPAHLRSCPSPHLPRRSPLPCIVLLCDNLPAVQAFNCGYSSNPSLAYLLCAAARVQLQTRVAAFVFHIDGANNPVADAISRFKPLPSQCPPLSLVTLPVRLRSLLDAVRNAESSPESSATRTTPRTRRGDCGLSSALTLVPTSCMTTPMWLAPSTPTYGSTSPYSSPHYDGGMGDRGCAAQPSPRTCPVLAPSWASSLPRLCRLNDQSLRISSAVHGTRGGQLLHAIESLCRPRSSGMPSPTPLWTSPSVPPLQ